MNIEQILAILIFAAMFIVIMSGKLHRYIPALAFDLFWFWIPCQAS